MAMRSAPAFALRGLRRFSSRRPVSSPINQEPTSDLLVSGKSLFPFSFISSSYLRLSFCLLSLSFDFEFKDFLVVGMFVYSVCPGYCETSCDLIAIF